MNREEKAKRKVNSYLCNRYNWTSVIRREKKWAKTVSENTMAENFPNGV